MSEKNKKAVEQAETQTASPSEIKKPKCGIIMPISPIDGCSAEHWSDVLAILKDVCDSIGFEADLVSNAEESHIIQKTIIENIYNSDIVICDVSCKNANVMFELGMRLAFDKPTIVIKDDRTSYSFDTSPLEHLGYPRDLRFPVMIEFKNTLKTKLLSTLEKSKREDYSSFLKNFGQYKIAHLEEKEITTNEYFIEELKNINRRLDILSPQFDTVYNKSKRYKFNFTEKILDNKEVIKGINLDQVYKLDILLRNFIRDNNILKIDDFTNVKYELLCFCDLLFRSFGYDETKKMISSYLNNAN